MNFKLLLIILLGIQIIPLSAQKRPLTVLKTYKIGDKFHLQQQTTFETVMEMKGSPLKSVNQSITDSEYEVMSSNSDGSLNWEIRTKRLQTKITNTKGEKNVYDSHDNTRKSEDLTSKMNDCIAESVIKMITDEKNMVIYKITGLDQMIENMHYELSEKEKSILPNYKTMFKSIISDSTMFEQMQEMRGFYPKKPVKVGKKWRIKRSIKTIMPIKAEIEYLLKTRNDQEAIIEISTKIINDDSKPIEVNLGKSKATYALKGNGNGIIILSQPDGVMKKSTHTINMDGTMEIKEMTIPIKIKTEIILIYSY
jgi:Family of unknown function (DUF6263)